MRHEEIRSLTSVRFIAAFYVFLLHINLLQPLSTVPWIDNFLSQGGAGMSLFFMLSGFILAYRYDGVDLKAAGYYRNRFARIYPVYFLSGLVTLPWMVSSLWPQHQEFSSVILIVIANILLLQAWYNPLFDVWNKGSWSISAEMFFYMLFPHILPWFKRLTRDQIVLLALVLYFVSSVIIVRFSLADIHTMQIGYSFPLLRLPEFIMGICCYYFSKTGLSRSREIPLLCMASLVVMVVAFCMANLKFPQQVVMQNWIVQPVIFLGILSLIRKDSIAARLLSKPVFVQLGHISYCFYAFQSLIRWLLVENEEMLLERFPCLADGKMLFLLAFPVLLALSYAGYYWVEEPARHFLRSRKRKA